MRRRLLVTSTLFAAAAFGQGPAFEVASVRASESGGERRGPREAIQVSPDGVIMRNVSMRSCVRWAYHVLEFQVNGPDWIGSQRYNITAKATGEVPEEQLRLMMQTLLADRFKMATHRQTREMQAYLLEVGKNGPKFKESATAGEPDIQPDPQRMSVVAQRTPVAHLVDLLANVLRAPVIDQTGLTSKYDVSIDVAKYVADFRGPGAERDVPPDPIAIIMRGLQEELGLKLEAKKMPIDLVIIDHAEKVPSEN